jgi:hypothetical protein
MAETSTDSVAESFLPRYQNLSAELCDLIIAPNSVAASVLSRSQKSSVDYVI